MYLKYMQENFKKNLLIQFGVIIPLSFIAGIGNLTIFEFVAMFVACFILFILLFFERNRTKSFFNIFIIWTDFLYVLGVLGLKEIRCEGIICFCIIRNGYVLITKFYHIKGYKDNDLSANDNEQ